MFSVRKELNTGVIIALNLCVQMFTRNIHASLTNIMKRKFKVCGSVCKCVRRFVSERERLMGRNEVCGRRIVLKIDSSIWNRRM